MNKNGNALEFDLTDRFLSDMHKMFCQGSLNDVCIKLHDGEVKANKSLLAARCEYFAAAFRWKENNNHSMEEVVVRDCSKKIMSHIIEYIFTGKLKSKNLNLLEFFELRYQVRKMFPGDILVDQIEDILKDAFKLRTNLPTNEEIVKALSLVENGNLQPDVLVELARAIERKIGYASKKYERIETLANLVSYGVIKSVKKMSLFLRDGGVLQINNLQALVSCVTELQIVNNSSDSIATLLESVHCKELDLFAEKLNQEETEALVRAMTSRVETLRLVLSKNFDMDFDTFRKYKRDGKCREVRIINNYDYDLTILLDSVNCKELHIKRH